MKSLPIYLATYPTASHPTRGAWIEIPGAVVCHDLDSRRTPHGVRGLKSDARHGWHHQSGRTPHGVRGLKLAGHVAAPGPDTSHPTRGAWIEIVSVQRLRHGPGPSHPTRGAWIEISQADGTGQGCNRRTPHGVRGLKWPSGTVEPVPARSHPTRGAWIEMRM